MVRGPMEVRRTPERASSAEQRAHQRPRRAGDRPALERVERPAARVAALRRAGGGAVAHDAQRLRRPRRRGRARWRAGPADESIICSIGVTPTIDVGLVAAAVGDRAHHAGDAVGAGDVDRAAAHALRDAAGLRRSAAPPRAPAPARRRARRTCCCTSMTVTGNVTMSVPRTTVRACADHPRLHLGQREDRVGRRGRCRPSRAPRPPRRRAASAARAVRRLTGTPCAAAFGRTLNHVSRSPSLPRSVQPLNVAVRPEAVVTRACTTRGETPRRTTSTAVTGAPRPSRSPRRARAERRRVGPDVVRADLVEGIRDALQVGPRSAPREDVLDVLRSPAGRGEEVGGDDGAIVCQHRAAGLSHRPVRARVLARPRRRRPGCARRRRRRRCWWGSWWRARSCAPRWPGRRGRRGRRRPSSTASRAARRRGGSPPWPTTFTRSKRPPDGSARMPPR